MDPQLAGKTVLVTGGSKGIGLACARAFLAEGSRVAICSRSQAHLEAAAQALVGDGRTLHTFVADLSARGAAPRLVAEVEAALGPVDVLVASAGAARRIVPARLDEQAWHDAMDAKLFPTLHVVQAVLPGMAQRRRGAVVSVIGQGGKVASESHLPGGAANAALMLATAGLAAAYGPHGVRVNAVNPGLTLTDRATAAFRVEAERLGSTPDEVRAAGERRNPLRRYGRPEEVAEVVLFLASERASYVNGAVLALDGGAAATVV